MGYGWEKLERIKTDCIWVNLKYNPRNHPVLSSGGDFANKTLLPHHFQV